MEYVIIPAVAFLASLLTFFSGFGLGTILLAATAIFFPVNVAVALTAIVHLLNSIFIFTLKAKHTNINVLLRFGLIAAAASFLGAQLLFHISGLKPWLTYHLFDGSYSLSPVKLVIAILIMTFGLWEILPGLKSIAFNRNFLPLGGALSGFLGGLSGLQGALRSAFLVRSGLYKESYIATGAAVAILVDIPRLSVYTSSFSLVSTQGNFILLASASIAGFLGALAGNFWVKKVTMDIMQTLVSIMLLVIAIALGMGLI
jgi:uncharacterized membrane protein YfcA